MAVITHKTISFSDMGEIKELAEISEAIVFRDGEAKTVTMKQLKRKAAPSPTLTVTAPTGSAVTVSKDDMSYSQVGETTTFKIPEYGNWTIKAELGELSVTQVLTVDTVKQYTLTITY